MLNPGGQNRMN